MAKTTTQIEQDKLYIEGMTNHLNKLLEKMKELTAKKQTNKEAIAAKEKSKKKAIRNKDFLMDYSDDMAKKKLETIIFGISTIIVPALLIILEVILSNIIGDAAWYEIAKYVATISAAIATITSIVDIYQNKKNFKEIASRILPGEDIEDNEETRKRCLYILKQNILDIDFELERLSRKQENKSIEITDLGIDIKGLRSYISGLEKQLEADKSERREIGAALLEMAVDGCITGQHIAPQSQIAVDGQSYIYAPPTGRH